MRLEELTFESRVFAKLPEMPQHMSELPPMLRQNLTVPNLIAQVEAMYRTYIIDHWQALAHELLEPKVAEALRAVRMLGPPVDQLTVKQVMQAVLVQLDFDKMALLLTDEAAKEKWTIYSKPDHSQAFRELALNLPDQSLNILTYGQQLKTTVACVMDSIQRWLMEAAYLQIIEQQICAAFKRCPWTAETGLARRAEAAEAMRLERFVSLKDEILQRGLQRAVPTERIMMELMMDLKPVAAMLRLDITRLSPCSLQDLEHAAHAAIIQEVFLPLQQGSFITCVPHDFPLEESEWDQQFRRKADEVLSNLQHALKVIKTIHIQVDEVPRSPWPAQP